MRRLTSGQRIAGGLVAGFITVLTLVLPWFDVLGRQRSSIDIIRSASILDVIEGWVRVLVIIGWLLAPILVSIAMFVAAAGKHRTSAILLLPVGLTTVLIVGAGLVISEVDLAWGAFVGLLSAICTSILAIMVISNRPPRNDRAHP